MPSETPDADGQRQHGHGGEGRQSAHDPQRVRRILPQLGEVLARPGAQQAGNRLRPEAHEAESSGGVAALGAERLFHVPAIGGAEVLREQQADEPAEQAEIVRLSGSSDQARFAHGQLRARLFSVVERRPISAPIATARPSFDSGW